MYIYRSNRVDILAACLADLCRPPLSSPFLPECIVVQSKGMATWLTMRLADHFGVWANPDFPRPRQLVQRLLTASLGREAERTADFSRELLTMAVLEQLPRLLARPEFAPVAQYFATGSDDLKWVQLAEKIAHVFDQYAVFRPEMVLGWEAGQDTALSPDALWQPILWRAITAQIVSPAGLFRVAYQRLQAGELAVPEALPERVFLFGITTLPPVYLSLFAELARQLPVHLLLCSPAEEYWGDVASREAVSHILTRAAPQADRENMHLSVGPPLLAALGGQGRDFQVLLEERLTGVVEDQQLFVAEPAPRQMLQVLQEDILRLRHRHGRAEAEDCRPLPLADADDSIAMHCCHSPLREVEVLQDQLLAMLNRDECLAPRDIVVMVPDIERYAPFVEAVFDRDPTDERYIPFCVADRAISREAPLVEAFWALLELLQSRMTASGLLDFLAFAPVHERFGMAAEDLEQVERWVVQSGIRWGIDEADRARHGQPAARQNTWRFGFDRLLLGYALPAQEGFLYQGVLPYDEVEGQDAALIGSLLACCETLFDWAVKVREPRTPAGWQRVVVELLADLFAPGKDEEWQRQKITAATAALAADSLRIGTKRTFDLRAFARLLRNRIETDSGEHGFLQGGVTFCAMLPMRSIPFGVVCLLGMNDGDYPRLQHAVSFDLIAREPQRGDRSRRNDDRYLFLEALLAARRCFYVSFVGRSIRDNARLAPSVLVDELLDCLAGSFRLPSETAEAMDDSIAHRQRLAARLLVAHPLQPFNRAYFDEASPQLFSYATVYHAAAIRQLAGLRADRPFAAGVTATQQAGAAMVSLDELKRFFKNPARWFCREVLDLLLHDTDEVIPDREPVSLDALATYQLGVQMLGKAATMPLAGLARLLQGKGGLPPGAAGLAVLHKMAKIIGPLHNEFGRHRRGDQPEVCGVSLRLPDDSLLTGELTGLFPWGLVRVTPAKRSPFFLLAGWIDHLAACAVSGAEPVTTILIHRGEKEEAGVAVLAPVNESLALLAELVRLQKRGARQPLPFFPYASHAYALAMAGNADDEQQQQAARRKAWSAFRQTPFHGTRPAEGDDPYVRKVFGADLFSDYRLVAEFTAVAGQVWNPLLRHLEKPA